ncbi:MAG: membrane protein insertase YidC [Bifidobacteriaceae bacterium]|jgi:YidC/Oxa1 family membrane protein insertase|nr:membrane protein insertase YidC [Bifidobacteriaceae bacterium]
MMQAFYSIFYPLEWLISWVMYFFHSVFVFFGMKDGPGFAWCLSIIFLTFFVRACIFPLFLRQMHSMRNMQAIQPEMMRIQRKYKGKTDAASKEAMQRETMKLYQDNHTNPMGSCLPSVIQMPVFFSLFNVLRSITTIANGKSSPIGAFTKEVAGEIENTVFINVKLSDMFSTVSGGGKITIGIFVALMCLTMFYMQFHNTRRNLPRASMQGTQYRTQQIMAYVFPVMYIFSGIVMPFGVLLYWLTNNLWTLGQSMWQVHMFPTPGSPAHEQKEKRDREREEARRRREGLPSIEEEQLQKAKEEAEKRASHGSYQRAQPVRKKRKKK